MNERKMLTIRITDEYFRRGRGLTSVAVMEPNSLGGTNLLFRYAVPPEDADELRLCLDSMLIALDYDTRHEHGEWRE